MDDPIQEGTGRQDNLSRTQQLTIGQNHSRYLLAFKNQFSRFTQNHCQILLLADCLLRGGAVKCAI